MESYGKKLRRVLGMYTKLLKGMTLNKAAEAVDYGVNERTIQRDISDLRSFCGDSSGENEYLDGIIYDAKRKGYRMVNGTMLKLSNSEILAICKILLASRSLPTNDMQSILNRLVSGCVPEENQKLVTELIGNEMLHYIEPRHGKNVLDIMWEIGEAVRECRYIEITYTRLKDKKSVKRKLKPVAILFSEYYYYLTAFLDDKETHESFEVLDDAFPTIYRLDRIEKLEVLEEHFKIPYSDRFQEGEFRKRVQFMYGGKLERIRFEYSGTDVNAILDRLPTAKILWEKDGVYTISAEVFGKGIDMWMRGQGDVVKRLG